MADRKVGRVPRLSLSLRFYQVHRTGNARIKGMNGAQQLQWLLPVIDPVHE